MAQEKNDVTNASLFADVFRLRHEIFKGRLNWEVDSEDGLERDCFDDLDPYHIVMQSQDGAVNGCWRALPTTGDYMLKDIFPQLLQGEKAPEQENIWEISRLAVRKGSAMPKRGSIGDVSIGLVRSFRDFALKHGIHAYVTVTTLAGERLLKQLGVELRRLGEGKSIQVGIERSVALWIDVNQSLNVVAH